MTSIPLTQGQHALVDDEDVELINKYKWCAHYQPTRASGKYNVVHTDKQGKSLLMHRVIMDAKKGQIVDHIDRNPLNNQRSNLRFANHSTNGQNQGLKRNNTSGYKGVHWDKGRKIWHATITLDKKVIHIGRYSNLEDAALAYNEAATEKFGEYSVLNIIRKRG